MLAQEASFQCHIQNASPCGHINEFLFSYMILYGCFRFSGILFNVFGKFEDNLRSEIMDKMLKVVMHALDKSCKDELKEISLISEQQNVVRGHLVY